MSAEKKGKALCRQLERQLAVEREYVAAVESQHYGRKLAAKVKLDAGRQRVERLMREFLRAIG